MLANDNVPVLGAFARMLERITGVGKLDFDNRTRYKYLIESTTRRNTDILHESRIDFCEITDISIEKQISLEHYFDNFNGTIDSELCHPVLHEFWVAGRN
jgi:hypothetical protein